MSNVTRRGGDVCALKISLTPPLFIEVPVPGLESERSCNIVVGCRFCSHNAFVPPVTLVLSSPAIVVRDIVIAAVRPSHFLFFLTTIIFYSNACYNHLHQPKLLMKQYIYNKYREICNKVILK